VCVCVCERVVSYTDLRHKIMRVCGVCVCVCVCVCMHALPQGKKDLTKVKSDPPQGKRDLLTGKRDLNQEALTQEFSKVSKRDLLHGKRDLLQVKKTNYVTKQPKKLTNTNSGAFNAGKQGHEPESDHATFPPGLD